MSARTALRAVAIVAGIAMFAQSLRVLGVERVVDGIGRVGWGFAAIVLLSGARELLRALAWTRTVEGPVRLGFAQAFRARLVGEALNALLPMGMVVGEPTKASQVGATVPFAAAFKGLVVEFAFYCLSLVLLFGAGASALMLLSDAGPGALAASLGLAAAAPAIAVPRLRRNLRNSTAVGPSIDGGGATGAMTTWVRRRVHDVRDVVFGFASRHPEHVRAIVAFEIGYQILAVAEVYVTLRCVSPIRPTLASAIVLETVGRAITMMFKVLPLRVGVDEVGASLFAEQVHLAAATGVTLALVRKLRLLFWSAIGLALLAHRSQMAPVSARP